MEPDEEESIDSGNLRIAPNMEMRIKTWNDDMVEFDRCYNLLDEAIGLNRDSNFCKSLFEVNTNYMKTVEQICGIEHDWLGYWRYDCGHGTTPMEVTTASGKHIKLDSVDRLIEVLNS